LQFPDEKSGAGTPGFRRIALSLPKKYTFMNTKALLEPMGSWAWWRSWFLIFLGCSIMGAGFVLFVNPYNFVPGDRKSVV